MTTCASCGRQMTDQGVICHDDTDLLTDDLRRLGGWTSSDGRHTHGLLADLLTAGTRNDHIPRQAGRNDDDGHTLDHRYPIVTSTAPTPANLDALHLQAAAWNAITTWTRNLLDDLGLPCDHASCSIRSIGPVCWRTAEAARAYAGPTAWLIERAPTIRTRPWAADMLAQISGSNGLTVRALRMVDRPPGICRIPCPACGERVPIEPDEPIIRCTCGEWGTVTWWVERVAPRAPEPMRLSALPGWMLLRGYIVTVDQLRQWADRERITPTRTAGPGSARLFDPTAVLAVADQTRGIRRTTALLRA